MGSRRSSSGRVSVRARSRSRSSTGVRSGTADLLLDQSVQKVRGRLRGRLHGVEGSPLLGGEQVQAGQPAGGVGQGVLQEPYVVLGEALHGGAVEEVGGVLQGAEQSVRQL